MHTNVILTTRRRIHLQPNYTNTKLKAWFRRLLRHPARKRSGSILNRHTPRPTQGKTTAKTIKQTNVENLNGNIKLPTHIHSYTQTQY